MGFLTPDVTWYVGNFIYSGKYLYWSVGGLAFLQQWTTVFNMCDQRSYVPNRIP